MFMASKKFILGGNRKYGPLRLRLSSLEETRGSVKRVFRIKIPRTLLKVKWDKKVCFYIGMDCAYLTYRL